jgi:beta-N-acetylhexosaminidase
MLVWDSLRAVPLSHLNHSARVLSITVARRADLPAGATFDEQLRARFDAARSEFVDLDSPENGASYWRLLQAADSADVVLVSSYITQRWDAATAGAPASFVEFVRQLTIRGARPIVISFGNPYLLRAMPDVPAYLVAWGGFPVMQRAAARALLGLSPISGRLPITISSFAPRGAGEIRTALSPP